MLPESTCSGVDTNAPSQSEVDDLLLERFSLWPVAEDVQGPVGVSARDGCERFQQQVEALLARQPAGGDHPMRAHVGLCPQAVRYRIGDGDDRRTRRSKQSLI